MIAPGQGRIFEAIPMAVRLARFKDSLSPQPLACARSAMAMTWIKWLAANNHDDVASDGGISMNANSDLSSYELDAWGQDLVERDDAASRFAEAASDYEVILPETLSGMGF